MFDALSLPTPADVSRVARRTALGALIVGFLGLALCLLLGAPLVGLGLCLGLALGLGNFRLVSASVLKAGARASENKRKPLAVNTLARLGVISVITLGLLFLSFDLGFGVLAGLAGFQFLLLINVAGSMVRGAAADPGAAARPSVDVPSADVRSPDLPPAPGQIGGGTAKPPEGD